MSLEQLRQSVRTFAEESVLPFILPTPQDVGDFYDRNNRVIAEIYGGNMHYGYWTGPDDDSDFEQAGARLTDIMIGKLQVGPGDTVLDLGCGPGKPGVRLARVTGASVVGVSISRQDVELANALAQAEGLADRAVFRHADAMDLPFEPESFDAVLALESIVHIPDRAHVLKQVARVLRPGGRVALTDFISLSEVDDEEELQALAGMLAAWRAAPLVRLADYPGYAEAAGLVIDEMVDITEHTKYTFEKTYAALRAYAGDHGELSPDMAGILAMGADVDWAQAIEGPQSEGCAIVVAHR